MDIELNQREYHHPSYRAAGFWMRFWAYLVDLVVVFAINGIVLRFLKIVGGHQIMISQWTFSSVVAGVRCLLESGRLFFQQRVGVIWGSSWGIREKWRNCQVGNFGPSLTCGSCRY